MTTREMAIIDRNAAIVWLIQRYICLTALIEIDFASQLFSRQKGRVTKELWIPIKPSLVAADRPPFM